MILNHMCRTILIDIETYVQGLTYYSAACVQDFGLGFNLVSKTFLEKKIIFVLMR